MHNPCRSRVSAAPLVSLTATAGLSTGAAPPDSRCSNGHEPMMLFQIYTLVRWSVLQIHTILLASDNFCHYLRSKSTSLVDVPETRVKSIDRHEDFVINFFGRFVQTTSQNSPSNPPQSSFNLKFTWFLHNTAYLFMFSMSLFLSLPLSLFF
jgi:hypothetical protein